MKPELIRHPSELSKVTAFVTCERDGRAQLLLFQHPLAGIQLPAGSIEEGEDPITAAMREVAEETGLRDVHDASSLGSTRSTLPPRSRIMLTHQVPRLDARPDAPASGSRLSRGLTVELLEISSDEYARVRHDVLDHEQTPPALLSRSEGWILASSLGSIVIRHHVHLRHHGRGPARWTQDADGHHFAPFWAPLVPRPETCSAQSEWLDFAYEELVRRAAR